jgi:hypothetical protein
VADQDNIGCGCSPQSRRGRRHADVEELRHKWLSATRRSPIGSNFFPYCSIPPNRRSRAAKLRIASFTIRLPWTLQDQPRLDSSLIEVDDFAKPRFDFIRDHAATGADGA